MPTQDRTRLIPPIDILLCIAIAISFFASSHAIANDACLATQVTQADAAHRDSIRSLGWLEYQFTVRETKSGAGDRDDIVNEFVRAISICRTGMSWSDRGASGQLLSSGTASDGVWEFYDPAADTLYRYGLPELPARIPVAPNELGTFRIGTTLLSMAIAETTRGARFEVMDDAELGKCTYLHASNTGEKGFRVESRYYFPSKNNYLVGRFTQHVNGILSSEVDLSYSRTFGCLILKSCDYRFYGDDQSIDGMPAVRQRLSFRRKSVLKRNEECSRSTNSTTPKKTTLIKDNVQNIALEDRK